MNLGNFTQQTKGKAQYPEMLWSKPENRNYAGKMALIGGNLNGFSNLSNSYALLQKEVINSVSIELPDSLLKKLHGLLPEGIYLPSNPSGGLSKKALSEMLIHSINSDHTLMIGDLGQNSETEILIERFFEEHKGWTTIANDTIDLIGNVPNKILSRGKVNIVLSFSKLQKILTKAKYDKPLTSNLSLQGVAEILQDLTDRYNISIITFYLDKCIYAYSNKVGMAQIPEDYNLISVKSAVWIMQNPNKIFESISSAVYELL